MLSLLENVEKSVEVFYTYGSNSISHAQGFFSFVGQGLTSVYECIDSCVPDFLVPVLLSATGIYISARVLRW